MTTGSEPQPGPNPDEQPSVSTAEGTIEDWYAEVHGLPGVAIDEVPDSDTVDKDAGGDGDPNPHTETLPKDGPEHNISRFDGLAIAYPTASDARDIEPNKRLVRTTYKAADEDPNNQSFSLFAGAAKNPLEERDGVIPPFNPEDVANVGEAYTKFFDDPETGRGRRFTSYQELRQAQVEALLAAQEVAYDLNCPVSASILERFEVGEGDSIEPVFVAYGVGEGTIVAMDSDNTMHVLRDGTNGIIKVENSRMGGKAAVLKPLGGRNLKGVRASTTGYAEPDDLNNIAVIKERDVRVDTVLINLVGGMTLKEDETYRGIDAITTDISGGDADLTVSERIGKLIENHLAAKSGREGFVLVRPNIEVKPPDRVASPSLYEMKQHSTTVGVVTTGMIEGQDAVTAWSAEPKRRRAESEGPWTPENTDTFPYVHEIVTPDGDSTTFFGLFEAVPDDAANGRKVAKVLRSATDRFVNDDEAAAVTETDTTTYFNDWAQSMDNAAQDAIGEAPGQAVGLFGVALPNRDGSLAVRMRSIGTIQAVKVGREAAEFINRTNTDQDASIQKELSNRRSDSQTWWQAEEKVLSKQDTVEPSKAFGNVKQGKGRRAAVVQADSTIDHETMGGDVLLQPGEVLIAYTQATGGIIGGERLIPTLSNEEALALIAHSPLLTQGQKAREIVRLSKDGRRDATNTAKDRGVIVIEAPDRDGPSIEDNRTQPIEAFETHHIEAAKRLYRLRQRELSKIYAYAKEQGKWDDFTRQLAFDLEASLDNYAAIIVSSLSSEDQLEMRERLRTEKNLGYSHLLPVRSSSEESGDS